MKNTYSRLWQVSGSQGDSNVMISIQQTLLKKDTDQAAEDKAQSPKPSSPPPHTHTDTLVQSNKCVCLSVYLIH